MSPSFAQRRNLNLPHIHVAVSLLFGIILGVQLASIWNVNTPAIEQVWDVPACPKERGGGQSATDTAANATGLRDGQPSKPMEETIGMENATFQQKRQNHSPTTGKSSTSPNNYIYSSPVETMMNHFKTAAMAREAHKHDRYLVDSLAYITKFKDAAAYTKYANQSSSASPKLITLVVLTVKRSVPYLAVLVSMLLRGQHPSVFMEKMDLHVANIERRAGREHHYIFEDLQDKLARFVNFHNWTAKCPKHSGLRDPYMADQRLDYMKALRLCSRSKSKWCVIFEDDAIPCVDFAAKFERYVDREVFPNATFDGREDVPLDKVAMVKLYDPYNQAMFGKSGHDVSDVMYAQEEYHQDRALDLLEAADAGVTVDKISFRIRRVGEGYGIVANAYPFDIVSRAISFLKRGPLGKPTDTSLVLDFVLRNKLVRLGTSPSLVNHLGFYSENSGTNLRAGISTDVRFQLDDGPDISDARSRNDSALRPRRKKKQNKPRGRKGFM